MGDLPRLFNELIRFETELWNAVDARMRAVGLPLTWFEPMQVVDRHGGCRVNDIAQELAITVGGTSKLVDRIEASGLCRRRPNPHDGRSSIIVLTTSGRRRLTKAAVTFEAELESWLGSELSAGAIERLTDTLARLRLRGRSRTPRSAPG